MVIIAFFNAGGGVGQTSLIYHLAWIYESLQMPVVVADLDPQAKLTSKFFETAELEMFWGGGKDPKNSIFGAINWLLDRPFRGDRPVPFPHRKGVSPNITVIPGDLELARVETNLSVRWYQRPQMSNQVVKYLLDFRDMLRRTANEHGAELVLVDVGPNLTAINRFAMIISDLTVIPLGPNQRSLYGLRAFGPSLWQWRRECEKFFDDRHLDYPRIPARPLHVAGYIVQQAHCYDQLADLRFHWSDRVRLEYQRSIIHQSSEQVDVAVPQPLATIRYHRGLLALAEHARKPMFCLTPADGVLDNQMEEVTSSYHQFLDVAKRIAETCGIDIPCSAPNS